VTTDGYDFSVLARRFQLEDISPTVPYLQYSQDYGQKPDTAVERASRKRQLQDIEKTPGDYPLDGRLNTADSTPDSESVVPLCERTVTRQWLHSWGYGPQCIDTMPEHADNMTVDGGAPPVKRNREEVLAERKAALEGKDGMQSLLLQMMHKMDDNTERIQDAIGVQGTKIDNVQAQVQKQGVTISNLETSVQGLETKHNRLETIVQGLQGQVRAGSVASDASTRPDNTRTGRYQAPGTTYFSPTYVELKGWVTNWSDRDRRSQEMLMWEDVKVLIDNITNHCLSEDDRVHVCVDGTERINAGRYMFGSAKIKFKPGTDRDIIWRVKRCIDLVTVPPAKRPAPPPGIQIAAPQCLIENMKQVINPESIKVSVECPEWKRDHVKAVGRFCGTIRSMCTQIGIEVIAVRGEMGPPKSTIWTVPTTAAPRPMLLAEFTTTRATWEVSSETVDRLHQLIPAFTKTKADIETEVNRRV